MFQSMTQLLGSCNSSGSQSSASSRSSGASGVTDAAAATQKQYTVVQAPAVQSPGLGSAFGQAATQKQYTVVQAPAVQSPGLGSAFSQAPTQKQYPVVQTPAGQSLGLKKAFSQAATQKQYTVVQSPPVLSLGPGKAFGQASRSQPGEGPQRLFASGSGEQAKLVGVVVNISEGTSFDENFREVEPVTVPGERISTYSMLCCDVGRLHDLLNGDQKPPAAPSTWAELLEDIQSVPADGVTLNWECCSGCSDQGFPRSRGATRAQAPTMLLAGLAVNRGFTIMFSDFSLKALIAEWSEEHLGPNPFSRLRQGCTGQMVLEFLPAELQVKEVPQQLQVVGELCAEQGKAAVKAMSDTILYTLNPSRAATELYVLKVLTVVSEVSGGLAMPDAMKCSVGDGPDEKRGAAGHVTLTYASGGQLVASAGHWIELSRLDTTEEQVAQVAARNFGAEMRTQYESELAQFSSAQERYDCSQRYSKMMVQQSVPTRMKCRTKY